MDEKKLGYNIINIVVIGLTAGLFLYDYRNVAEFFSGKTAASILILIITVILVHAVKAGRLYIALYGAEIDFVTFLKIYCKVTPVSVVFPFKLGEFFRMYCYGKQLRSVLKGIVIILLDRFMDTIALVTMLLLVWVFNGGHIPSIAYLLSIFLILALLIYFLFPGVYRFWKKYLLRARASKNKIRALKMLEALHMIYREIENVARGRGVILYFMSLFAWGVEAGSLALLNGFSRNGELNQMISDYLMSAMSGNQSMELKQFVFASVVLLIVSYLFLKAGKMIAAKKEYR